MIKQKVKELLSPYTDTANALLQGGAETDGVLHLLDSKMKTINKIAEIGWVLKPSCWGKGHASALTKQLLDKAADQKKAAVIECVPEQAATRAIARKFGFSLLQEKDGLLVYRREIT